MQLVSLAVCPTPCAEGDAGTGQDVKPASGYAQTPRQPLQAASKPSCGVDARVGWTVGGAHTVDSTRIMAGSWPPLAPAGGQSGPSKPDPEELLLPHECKALEAAADDSETGVCAQAAKWDHDLGDGASLH